MVFRIDSQYIDSVGKLRIIYGFFNSHLINLLTFPSAPLDKVSIELDHKVTPFLEINAAFIENFKEELESDQIWVTETGVWFKNSVFPPFVCVPINKDQVQQAILPPISFPLMIQGSPQSSLDAYKSRIHKANIFKQYVLFLYSCNRDNYSAENSFVIKDNPNYEFEKWNPPNWLSLENKKMFVLNRPFPPSFKLSTLSKLPSEIFRDLNSERLKMCIKEGGGQCLPNQLPKPVGETKNKWKEYQSPAGGHCLFHTILRADAKLNPKKYKLDLIDFDTWNINSINKNNFDHWDYIYKLRQSIQDEKNRGVQDAKNRIRENMKTLDHDEHEPFWGEAKDIQDLATQLNLCIMVYSKSSYKDFLYQFSQYPLCHETNVLRRQKRRRTNMRHGFFFPPSMAKYFFPMKRRVQR